MDETTTDVVPTEGGEQIAPQSDPSPEGAVQDSPGGESQYEALSQEVNKLSGMVRAFQSDEDRRIPAIERKLSAQAEQLEAYYQRRKAGQTHEQAQREQVLDEFVDRQLGDTNVPPTEALAAPTPVAVEDYLSPLLQATGLADTDAGVIEIVRKENDPAKRMIAIAQLAEERKQAKQIDPNTAAVMASGGGQAPVTETHESVSAELNALYNLPITPENRKRIAELGKKLKELLPKK